jgi:raffinose/stachyose/melibiose transport system permease protein
MISTKKERALQIILIVILSIMALYCLSPILLAFLNSFKTQGEIFTNILALPEKFNFENYVTTFKKMHYFRSFINSIIIVAIGMAGIVIFSAMAGWILCRTKTRLSKLFYSLFVFSMLIPFNSIMIPLYHIAGFLHLSNSTAGLGLIYIGLGVGMAIFIYYGFTKTIPIEIEEAAYIDGCSTLGIFIHIVMPLLGPVTATICIINILWMWNDFLLPIIMLRSSKNYTLLLSTNILFGQYSSDWPAILSALILTVIPVIVLYACLQKNILKGVIDGAVKG